MLSPVNDTPESIELKAAIARDKRWLGMGILGFVVILGVVAGVAYFRQLGEPVNQQVSEPASQPASVPVASVKPVEQEPQSYRIEILNASGVTGAASSAKAELESRFKIQDSSLEITTGNGDAQTGTTTLYKNDGLRRSRLAGILSELYPSAKVSIDSALAADVRLILGK